MAKSGGNSPNQIDSFNATVILKSLIPTEIELVKMGEGQIGVNVTEQIQLRIAQLNSQFIQTQSALSNG